VPNPRYGDSGQFVLELPQFQLMLPHVFVLTEVHRQTKRKLIFILNNVSMNLNFLFKVQ
jgi:hypothetical protein